MSTDAEGSNSYFHCLIFYEQFTRHDIKVDFDHQGAFMRRQQENKLKFRRQTVIRNPRNSTRIAAQINSNVSPLISSSDTNFGSDLQSQLEDDAPIILGEQIKQTQKLRNKDSGVYNVRTLGICGPAGN